MGVVHKLKPEVIKFIINNKQINPHLSCRRLASRSGKNIPADVMEHMINGFEWPSLEEGFKEIWQV